MARFTHPYSVLAALDLLSRWEPTPAEILGHLAMTVEELHQAGFAETVSKRGRYVHYVRLTVAGEERRRAAHEAAWKDGSG